MNTQTATETETQPQPAAAPAGIQRITLTGFMGAGKSTIGRLLAARLGWNFLDLDTHLEQRAGLTVPEIFSQHGEARFRRLESSALASALSQHSTVIALGGGVPESITNRLLLEQTPGTFTIFLDAPFSVLFDRCVLQDIARPVLADPDAAQGRFNARHPLYTRLARLTVETANLTPEETVEILLAKFSQLQQAIPYHS
jgi:shikimate kinase